MRGHLGFLERGNLKKVGTWPRKVGVDLPNQLCLFYLFFGRDGAGGWGAITTVNNVTLS